MAFVAGNNFYNTVNFQTLPNAGGNFIGGGQYSGDEFSNTSLDVILPTAAIGWGADFTGANTGTGLTFTILGDTVALGTHLGTPGTGFLGFISTNPFTTVDVGAGALPNEFWAMDNMTWAAEPVPEPATMIALGVGALAVIRRRKRK